MGGAAIHSSIHIWSGRGESFSEPWTYPESDTDCPYNSLVTTPPLLPRLSKFILNRIKQNWKLFFPCRACHENRQSRINDVRIKGEIKSHTHKIRFCKEKTSLLYLHYFTSYIVYKDMTLDIFIDLYTEWFSVCPNITSRFTTIASSKENNNTNKTCKYVHERKHNGSRVVSMKRNMNFNIQPPTMFIFVVFHKTGLVESCSSFEDLSAYKMSLTPADWFNFCIRLRSLNVRHFGTIKATGLKIMASRWSSMALPSDQISHKYPNCQELLRARE
jgi:hypothetical protein